jgi:hypothetical protein
LFQQGTGGAAGGVETNLQLLLYKEQHGSAKAMGAMFRTVTTKAIREVQQTVPKATREATSSIVASALSASFASQEENSPLMSSMRHAMGRPTTKTIIGEQVVDVRSNQKTSGTRHNRNNLAGHILPPNVLVPGLVAKSPEDPARSNSPTGGVARSAAAANKTTNRPRHYRQHHDVFAVDDDDDDDIDIDGDKAAFAGMSSDEIEVQRALYEQYYQQSLAVTPSPEVLGSRLQYIGSDLPEATYESPSKGLTQRASSRLLAACIDQEPIEGVSEAEAMAGMDMTLDDPTRAQQIVSIRKKDSETKKRPFGTPEAAAAIAKYAGMKKAPPK